VTEDCERVLPLFSSATGDCCVSDIFKKTGIC